MDFLTLERSKGGYHHILVITDHFSRFAVAVPTKNLTAKTTAEAFYDNFITNYGNPVRIHSDHSERFNRTLPDVLGTLHPSQKSNWKKYLSPKLTIALDMEVQDSLPFLDVWERSNTTC